MTYCRLILLSLVIWASLPTAIGAQIVEQPIIIHSIHIVSGTNGDFPSDANKTVDFGDDVRMYAAVEVRDALGRTGYLCATDTIIMDGVKTTALPFNDHLGQYRISWYRVENDCREKYYSNTSPEWHWDWLDYKETVMDSNVISIAADVAPAILSPVTLDGVAVGTMRYRVKLIYNGREYISPGSDDRYKGCITENVHRISRRGNTGNKILDNAIAMCNCPYIWGSASFTGSRFDNQAGRFLGADCADFAVAAARMAGYQKMPYVGSRALEPLTDQVASMRKEVESVYLGNDGRILLDSSHVRPGDFIVWDGHVGLIYKDTEPLGVLDTSDLVLHTLFNEPGVTTIKSAFRGKFKILRPKPSQR